MWKESQANTNYTQLTTRPLTYNKSKKKLNSVSTLAKDQAKKQPTLLLVEDNLDMVTYLKHILTADYQIEVARNGQEGIDKAFDLFRDIIISDVTMPQRTGFELVEILKASELTNHIPIILLTGKTEYADKLKGLTYGADAYLMKPFNKAELYIRLKNLLALRKQLEQKYAATAIAEAKNKIAVTQVSKAALLVKMDEILEAQYKNSDFGVQELTQSLMLSYSQFYRKLKLLNEPTPVIYIRAFRLEKAKKILQQEITLNISEVAYRVGFDDPNYFSRVFSDYFGQSPNSMRNTP